MIDKEASRTETGTSLPEERIAEQVKMLEIHLTEGRAEFDRKTLHLVANIEQLLQDYPELAILLGLDLIERIRDEDIRIRNNSVGA